MSSANCPICASYSEDAFVSRHDLNVLKCQSDSCGHLFVEQPDPEQGVMKKESTVQEIIDLSRQLQETYRERNERLIDFWTSRGFLNERTQLLDVGSGVGHMVESLRKRYVSMEITCVEPSRPYQLHLEQCGFNVISEIDSVRGKFDSILLVEVIEHVLDPRDLLRKAKLRLNDKGRIFLTTPCGELPKKNRNTKAYDEESHIHFFTEKSLKSACQLASLKPIELEYIEAVYPKSPKPKGLRSKINYTVAKLLEETGFMDSPSKIRLKRTDKEGFLHLTGFISLP